MTARLRLARGLARTRRRQRRGAYAYLSAFARRCRLGSAADVVRLLRVRRAPSRATRIAIERATARWQTPVMAASWGRS